MLCEFLCYLLKIKNKKLLHDEIDFLLLKIKMEKIFTHMNSLSEVTFHLQYWGQYCLWKMRIGVYTYSIVGKYHVSSQKKKKKEASLFKINAVPFQAVVGCSKEVLQIGFWVPN